MSKQNPSYITPNRLGIYLFQYRIPKSCGLTQIFFRMSLRTRDTRQAQKQARKLVIIMEDILKEHFADPERLKIALEKAKRIFIDTDHLQLALDKHKQWQDIRDMSGWSEAENALTDLYGENEPSPENPTSPIDKLINKVDRLYSEVDKHFGKGAVSTDLSVSDVETVVTDAVKNRHKVLLTPVPIKEAFEKFITLEKGNWKPNSGYEDSFRDEMFPIFFTIVGDITTRDLTIEHSSKYLELILKLPKNRNKVKKYRNCSIEDLIQMEIPEEDQLSNTSKTNYLRRLSKFLKWLQTQNWALKDIQEPLRITLESDVDASEERDAYSCSDLESLFNSDQYNNGGHRYPFQFWVPLIGLFSGMRENEICQLFVTDIKQYEGTNIWCFDINQDDAKETKKSIKRKYHARFVPIHKKLIDMGFLEFVKSRKDKRVFPELPYKGRNKYQDKMQRWFNVTYTNKNNCNITNKKTCFHSFRHTFVNHLVHEVLMPSVKVSNMVGHKPQGETDGRYAGSSTMEDRNKYLQRVNFDDCIDFKKIREWKYHKFNKK